MLDQIPKGIWYLLLGFAGGVGALVLNIKTSGDEFWVKPFFWRTLVIDLVIVAIIAMPIAYLMGSYMDEIQMSKASSVVAYLSAVVSKDIVKYFHGQGLLGILSIFGKKP